MRDTITRARAGPELTGAARGGSAVQRRDSVTIGSPKAKNSREQNYMGLHTVGRGSERPPGMLALDYNPMGALQRCAVYAFRPSV